MRLAAAGQNTSYLVYRHTSTDFARTTRAEACTQTFVRQAASWCAARPRKAALRDSFVRLPPGLPSKHHAMKRRLVLLLATTASADDVLLRQLTASLGAPATPQALADVFIDDRFDFRFSGTSLI